MLSIKTVAKTLLFLFFLLSAATNSHAQLSSTWTSNSGNSNFSNAANWSNGLPGFTLAALFDGTSAPFGEVVVDQNRTVTAIEFTDEMGLKMLGPSTLTIANETRVANSAVTFLGGLGLATDFLFIGQADGSGSTASVTIAGAGTEVDSDCLYVGSEVESGSLSVLQGAQLSTSDTATIGDEELGVAVVDGNNSRWVVDQFLDVNEGVLQVSNGGEVITDTLNIGEEFLGSGELFLTGSNSQLQCTCCEIGGVASTGEMHVDSGATFSATGEISVRDCLSVAGFSEVDAQAIRLSISTSVLEIDNALLSGDLTINGVLEVASFSVASLDGEVRNNNEIVIGPGGQLLVFGEYVGSGEISGPGRVDFEAGVRVSTQMIAEGDVTFQADSVVEMQIFESSHDSIRVAGDLGITGSLFLETIDPDNEALSSGGEVMLINVQGTLTGSFAGLPEGAVVGSSINHEYTISYTGGNGNDIVIRSEVIDPQFCDAADIEFENGELTINGTLGPDDLVVTEIGGMLTIDVDTPAGECVLINAFNSQSVSLIVINGFGGADLIQVDAAIPTLLNGGFGPDEITGGTAMNEIFGGPGPDLIHGGPLNDTINAGRGQDTVFALGGDDMVIGGDADDELVGGPGNDTLLGGLGADTLSGNGGQDILIGNVGADILNGGSDDDELSGLGGPDQLLGGGGNDELRGGEGFDTLNGGPGIDTALDNGEVEIGIENS